MFDRINSEEGFDALDRAAYDAGMQDKELWGKATVRPCVECGKESDCYASCDDGDLCIRCCELDAQFAGDDSPDRWEESLGDLDDEPRDMTDVEADADTLRSCGWGTDEDYGYYGSGEDY